MRIVLTGGSTGGHVIPFEPIIAALRTAYAEQRGSLPGWVSKDGLEIYFLGVLDAQSTEFLKKLGVKTIAIPSGKLRRYASVLTLPDLFFWLPLGTIKALFQMWSIMPDVVMSKGGYGSVPTTLAAIFFRIPFLLHESDAVAGLSNRTLASFAAAVTVGFAATRHEQSAYKDRTIVTGTPVRSHLFVEEPAEAKRFFGFPVEEKTLLVMGGSQGAVKLNEVLLEILPSLVEDMTIIHLTGERNIEDVQEAAKVLLAASSRANYYKPYAYLGDELAHAFAAADLVVSRAGATALAELSHLRKPSIIVPLSDAAQDHQRRNATIFDQAQAVRMVSPENLGRSLFEQNIRDVMYDDSLRETLSANIARLDHPNAARDIADLLLKLAIGLQPFQPDLAKEKPSKRSRRQRRRKR